MAVTNERTLASADGRAQSGRSINRRTALRLIFEEGPLTRVDLARIMGLSKPTTGILMGELETGGLVAATGVIEGKVGRAATEYSIRPDVAMVAAVDLGRTMISLEVTTLGGAGHRPVKLSQSTDLSSADALLAQVALMLGELESAAGLRKAPVRVLSVAMPGVTDPRSGKVELAPNLPDFGDSDVRATLEQLTHASVVITNDVNAAAVGERTSGLAKNCEDFVFLVVGPGVGAGLVLDGQLRVGPSGVAGEIGWLPIGPRVQRGGDLRVGALESALAGSSLVRDYSRRKRGSASASIAPSAILASATQGEKAALASVDEFAFLLARAIASVVVSVDVDLAVLGGELGSHALFPDMVSRHLEGFLPVAPRVATSALGPDAALEGAAWIGSDLAREKLLDLASTL